MQKTARQRLALIAVTCLAGLLSWLVLRNLIAAGIAALAAGVSAQAVAAGTGKAAAAGASAINLPALCGAAAGSALLYPQLRGRPVVERLVLAGGSFAAAYFGGLLAFELWGLGPGLIGVAGTVFAYFIVAVLDTGLKLIKDFAWIKSLIERLVPGKGA